VPFYGYKCKKCGNFKDLNTISGREKTQCPKCRQECDRDVEFELSVGDTQVVTDHPRWSWSMAVPVSQLPEFRKKYPNITWNDKGQPLIKNRKDKLEQCKKRGFVELDRRQ